MANPIAVFTVTLPTADDALGRWLDEHGGNISMSCTMGIWCVRVSWRRLISASDDKGRHVEDWDVARYHRKPDVAFNRAVRAAMAIQRGEPLPEERD